MQPRMTARERDLFLAFARRSLRYLEFGTGGSTLLAVDAVQAWVISVGSSQAWLESVRVACPDAGDKLRLMHVDIGPVRDWGYPVGQEARARWPRYHGAVWDMPDSREADLCFIDGRFRVACFAQAVLQCGPGVLIGIHDFAMRDQYRVIHEIGREIAVADELAFFLPRPGTRDRAAEILAERQYETA